MKKEFVSSFKAMGFRVNSSKGEAFIKNEDLYYYLRLFKSEDDNGNDTYYFKYGLLINSPFESSFESFNNSVYLGRHCYGGERTDEWYAEEFPNLIVSAKEVALPWVQKMQCIENLIDHIEWRIQEGIQWLEPEQYQQDEARLSSAGQEIASLFGPSGNKINRNWVKRFYKSLAIIYNVNGNSQKAMDYITKYLEHIKSDSARSKEINAINQMLSAESWPKSI